MLSANKIDSGSFADGQVAVDAAGNAYLTGDFDSTITLGTTTLTTTTSGDTYLVKYNAQGAQQWARQGGAPGIYSGGIATDAAGNVLITGDITFRYFRWHNPNGWGDFLIPVFACRHRAGSQNDWNRWICLRPHFRQRRQYLCCWWL